MIEQGLWPRVEGGMAAFVPVLDSSLKDSDLVRGLPCGRQIVKLASTREEMDQTLRLRYRIFNEELGEGLESSRALGMDVDLFDQHCDHLIILEEGVGVVGTYRMLFGPRRPKIGFYTESEFDLSGLKYSKDQAVELGRACIDSHHRKRTTLMSLFWAMHRYMMLREARYLLGCGSLPKMSADDAEATYQAFLDKNAVDLRHGVRPLPTHDVPGVAAQGTAQIPALLAMYVEFGAKVLGRPAFDREFGCYDVPVAFDMDHLSAWGSGLLQKFDRRLLSAGASNE